MRQEIEDLRPRLKEFLYDCAVEINATKAAVFLFDGSSRFELVSEYGFRGAIRASADFHDPIVDRCGRGRNAFFVNGLAADPRMSEILFQSSTDRLLVAPMYFRGKLVGFVDMRDKSGRVPFDTTDIPKAQQIADRMAELFTSKDLFGHRFIALSATGAESSEQTATATAAASIPPPRLHAEVPPPVASNTPRLATVVLEARNLASSILLAPPVETLSETELRVAREVLRSILLIPGAVAATFSAVGHLGGVQEIASRSELTEQAKNLIQTKLNVWLSRRGQTPGQLRTSSVTLSGPNAPPIDAGSIQRVFTAPLSVGALQGLYLTVCFSENPERAAHELLTVLHNHLQTLLAHSIRHATSTSLQSRIVSHLLEPDFTRFPDLRHHCEAVAGLAERFARSLGLSQEEIEQAEAIAMVHDVGMRMLDYERLYRKPEPGPEEVDFFREHSVVGAALVEPLLGREIARAVLCHHERVDGSGYPHGLRGDEIPLLARVVQLCDAWVAMTDLDGYKPPEPREAALEKVAAAAGSQFDAQLATRFLSTLS